MGCVFCPYGSHVRSARGSRRISCKLPWFSTAHYCRCDYICSWIIVAYLGETLHAQKNLISFTILYDVRNWLLGFWCGISRIFKSICSAVFASDDLVDLLERSCPLAQRTQQRTTLVYRPLFS